MKLSACLLVWVSLCAMPAAHAAKVVAPPYAEFELRFSPYQPNVADNTLVHQIYDRVYNPSGKALFNGHSIMFSVEGDYFFLNEEGLFGIYGRAGYWTTGGSTRLCTAAGTVTKCSNETILSSTQGSDTASLSIVPVSVGAVYRVDQLKRNAGIPLVFTAKAGFDYYIWFARSGAATPVNGNIKGYGATLGFSASLGVALSLRIFDPGTGAEPRNGPSEYYLFAECAYVHGKSLDGKPRFDMTPRGTASTLSTLGLLFSF